MKLPVDPALTLLHEATAATLATNSTRLPGYPYGTAVPCILDEAHRPVLCLSALAEHTKNLLADPRASLLVVKAEGTNVQAAARLTVVGDVEQYEPPFELVARHLRYQPDLEQYLALDFIFFRLQPKGVRFIGGVGKMTWFEGDDWRGLPVFPLADERSLLNEVAPRLPPGIRLLGVDCFGIDYESRGTRRRQHFPEAPLPPEKLPDVVLRMGATLR